MKKIISVLMAAAIIACLFAGCGGTAKEAKTVGVYLSPAQLTYHNMRPEYNYYVTTFAHEELTLMDDNTYCLIVSSSTFSALELAESTSDAKGNERTNYITKIYGTYTSKPNDLDEDLTDVTLGAITRVVTCNDQTYFLDTASWTEAMGKAVVPPAGYDPSTGAAIKDENAAPWTAEQYLATISLAVTEVQVNNKHASFDFTEFGL